MRKVKEITNYLTSLYPHDLCSNFDLGKVGLQFGDGEAEVKKVLIALDGTSSVVQEAIDNNCELLVTHHPFMFNPMLHLDYSTPFGKKLMNVMKHNLNLYSMHTNFDTGDNGMNDILASLLNLRDVHGVTDEAEHDKFLKIGTIDEMSLDYFSDIVKEKFAEPYVRVVGDLNRKIKRVAVVGGAGSSCVLEAAFKNCDCIVTGEIHHNVALDAIDYNIAIIEVGHAVERLFKYEMRNRLAKQFPDVEFICATKEDNPFTYK